MLAAWNAGADHPLTNSCAKLRNGVAVDANGNVAITGRSTLALDFGGGSLASGGGEDCFVAKFDTNGTHLWSKRFGAAGPQWGKSVQFDPAGNVVLGGSFQADADFGGGPLTSAGDYDGFFAKLSP